MASKFGDTRAPRIVASVNATVTQELSVANVRIEDAKSRCWNVTLNRLDRVDRKPAIGGPADGWQANVSGPQNVYAFSGAQAFGNPPFPPRRTNPPYGNSPNITSQVMVGWGLNNIGQGNQNRLIADWPLLGQSFSVYGSYVEIWGLATFFGDTIPPGDMPQFSAMIVPADTGVSSTWLNYTVEVFNTINPLLGAAPTQGGALMSIPDFARQVKISLNSVYNGIATEFINLWDTKNGEAVAVWWNDRGNIVDSTYLSQVPGSYQFIDVPNRASMLSIYRTGQADTNAYLVRALWRISP